MDLAVASLIIAIVALLLSAYAIRQSTQFHNDEREAAELEAIKQYHSIKGDITLPIITGREAVPPEWIREWRDNLAAKAKQ